MSVQPLTERPLSAMKRVVANAVSRAPGTVTVAYLYWLADLQEDECAVPWCYDLASDLDHIVPVSKGGQTGPGNLQFLCERHNSMKRAHRWADFLDQLAHGERPSSAEWAPGPVHLRRSDPIDRLLYNGK